MTSNKETIETLGNLFWRLPYVTRLAFYHALLLQEHIPTNLDEDRAADLLKEALRLAGVEES